MFLVEIARGTLAKVSANGAASIVADLGGSPNGIAIGPDGVAYICNNGGFSWIERGDLLFRGHAVNAETCASIQRVDVPTVAVATLYASFESDPLKGSNDIVYDLDGGFWFTGHGQVRGTARDHGAIYHAKADKSGITRQRNEIMGPNLPN